MNASRTLILSCLVLASPVPAAAAPAEGDLAVLADGTRFRGELDAADANWRLAFHGEGLERTVSAAELICWGLCGEHRGPMAVLLADGGLVAADSISVHSGKVTIQSEVFPGQVIALESLAGVVFHASADPERDDALADRIVQSEGRFDRMLLLNGDELSGRLSGIADDVVNLETDLGLVRTPADRVRALIFNPAVRRQETKTDRLRAWVGLSDGSRLLAERMVIQGATRPATLTRSASEGTLAHSASEGKMTITAAGQTWTTARERLRFLQPLGGKAVYLSDVKPADYRQTPYVDLPWPMHADRNVTGGMLRSGGRLRLKGLGVHSAARLVYALDAISLRPLAGEGQGVRAFQRFEAEIGIDDSTGGRGSVRFRVLLDGRERFASRVMRGGDRPTPISVDLRGGKRLELVVDYADHADVLDHADWLDARLIR